MKKSFIKFITALSAMVLLIGGFTAVATAKAQPEQDITLSKSVSNDAGTMRHVAKGHTVPAEKKVYAGFHSLSGIPSGPHSFYQDYLYWSSSAAASITSYGSGHFYYGASNSSTLYSQLTIHYLDSN